MDYLRACYSADMYLFRDDPTRKTRVNWYRVKPETTPLGEPTVFTSSTWDDGLQFPALGEDRRSRVWRNVGPGRLTVRGPLGLCGSPDQFAKGCLTSDPLPPVDKASGQPSCCGSLFVDVPCNGIVVRMGACALVQTTPCALPICPPVVAVFGAGTGVLAVWSNRVCALRPALPGATQWIAVTNVPAGGQFFVNDNGTGQFVAPLTQGLDFERAPVPPPDSYTCQPIYMTWSHISVGHMVGSNFVVTGTISVQVLGPQE